MYEIVVCPTCSRRLQLPAEHLGRHVQCPHCETSFIAGETKPRPQSPPPPEAITVELPPAPQETEAEAPRPRRSRRLDVAKPAPRTRKAPFILGGLLIAGAVAGVSCCVFSQQGHNPPNFQPFANVREGPNIPFDGGPPPPPIDVPDRLLTAQEQKLHAMTFFQHFSGVMNNADNAGEMGSFDAAKLLEALYEQKLIPDAWRPDRDRLLADVRRGVLQTSVYRGDHWIHHEIMTVKQPRLHELIVVTRHPNRDTGLSLRLRWWLVHRDGAWRAQEVEYVDFGIRLSLLVAADLHPIRAGGAVVHGDVQAVRSAANAVMIKNDFDEAGRILRTVRADDLPKACAATHHLLLASIQSRNQLDAEALASCDAAQRCQPDNPGCEYLRSVVFNNLRRHELALTRARLAQEWLGDDPIVSFELGLALGGLNRFAEAAPFYRKVLDDYPDNHDAFLNLVRCVGRDVKNDDIADRFLKMKRPQDHFEQYASDCWTGRDLSTLQLLAEAMRKREPRHADASFYLALCQAEQQGMEPALKSFRAALDLQDLAARRDYYYTEFARTLAFRDHALQAYGKLPDRMRSFRALGEALKNAGKMDDLQQLVDLHQKKHPQDDYVQLYQAELYLRDEQFEQADRAFTRAFAAINDLTVQDRFRYSRVRARYLGGDVLGAYRDVGPQRATFQQLAGSCWADKKTADLEKLIEAHVQNDANDPELARFQWRIEILHKRFDEASKTLKSVLDRNPGIQPNRNFAQDFLFDMLDAGHVLEGYRRAPDPAVALDTIATDAASRHRPKELDRALAEHRQRFPNDPVLLMVVGQQAAAKQDWAKAAQNFSEGWPRLPEAKRQRWTYGYLFARVKLGQAIQAYHETGKRPEHFRQLTAMILNEKQDDPFEKLLEAHRPQRAIDPEFAAYEARLQILRGKSAEAAEILIGLLKTLPINDQRRIENSFLSDLAGFNFAAEMYRCMPDKTGAFAQMARRYHNPDRMKEFERLIAEHARHHPADPRLVIERAELHLLRGEFAQAEQQFLLAQRKNSPDAMARFGLMRARIKLGKAAETYHELGANSQAFQDLAHQCITLKDGAQLERLLAAHRQAFPAAKNLAAWGVEAHWLKKDYEATVKAIESDRAGSLKNATYRWKCESYLVRSLVRLKKPNEAVREAEAIDQRKGSSTTLLALALASAGDLPRVLAFLETKKDQRYFLDDCYHDEDLGPILRGAAFRAVQERFPPPPERPFSNMPFDDWD